MKEQALKFLKDNRCRIILVFILIIGFVSRVLFIDYQPNALNVDEASAGYEAWSILNHGVDRNGKFLPAFLIAWGNGQNALYSYLMMPFIMLFGLNTLSVRLPMAIIGCVSLVIMYLLLKELKDEKTALIGVAFFAICPWHIIKSRWGLESNVFPDMVLWATYLTVLSMKKQRTWLLYIASFILRFNSICIWNIIFLFTNIRYTFTNYISKEERNKNKECLYSSSNCWISFNANNIICFNQYF